MRLIGGKPWMQALVFWVVILIIGFALTTTASYLGILITVFSVAIFILLAHYWYKLSWVKSIVVWAVAFFLDFVIIYLLFMMFPAIVRYWYMPVGG